MTLRVLEFKEEALHRAVRGARFGRGYGPIVRQTMERASRLIEGNSLDLYREDYNKPQNERDNLDDKISLLNLSLFLFPSPILRSESIIKESNIFFGPVGRGGGLGTDEVSIWLVT